MRPRGRSVGLAQPYAKGTLDYDVIRAVNEQGIPDSILGPMCGLSRSALSNYRCGRRTMSREAIEKLLSRCGHRLAVVREK